MNKSGSLDDDLVKKIVSVCQVYLLFRNLSLFIQKK